MDGVLLRVTLRQLAAPILASLCIVIVRHKRTQSRHLTELTTTQTKLIQLLGIPPSALRAFKLSSGISAA